MIDLKAIGGFLDELNALDERMADRGPIKVLPRQASEIPHAPTIKARMDVVQQSLCVRRNYKDAKGHDLPGPAAGVAYDLAEVGNVEEIKTIQQGKDRANPKSTTIVKVGFPSGAHLWFDPSDLDAVP